ncbi:hypothetical protein wTkk_001244 [Wolbachia endosymbiont of Trichogramma kaykai]
MIKLTVDLEELSKQSEEKETKYFSRIKELEKKILIKKEKTVKSWKIIASIWRKKVKFNIKSTKSYYLRSIL